ncbi:hypothetical protein GCM10028778_17520 [Barrientosiimonas marina]|uniref:Lipoprotein n=1 Tax=Lentibacillus kimchii TaxID=1542911 RepID=A0ABW2UWP5_9BACI
MRLRALTVILFLLALVLTACSDDTKPVGPDKKGDATIAEADLTDFDKKLMNLATDMSFAYDIQLHNQEAKELQVTVEHYQNGEKVNEILNMASGLKNVKPSDNLKVVFLRQKAGEGQEKWVGSVIRANGSSSVENTVEAPSDDYASVSSGGISSQTSFTIGERQYASTIIHTNQHSVSQRTDLDTDEAIKQATDYEDVYLLSVRLNKQQGKLKKEAER